MKAHIVAAGCAMFCLMAAQSAMALTINYSYSAYENIASWGTMDINVVDNTTLSVLYTAAGNVPVNTQATGFAFSFTGEQQPVSISNPVVAGNNTSLTWQILDPQGKNKNDADKLSTISNRTDFDPDIDSQYAFAMAVTEGNATNFSPPGIAAGKQDIFYLNFLGTSFSDDAFRLASFVDLTAIRLQGFDDDTDLEGSLVLAGNPVPEPGTMMLLGAGFLGIAIYSKRRQKS